MAEVRLSRSFALPLYVFREGEAPAEPRVGGVCLRAGARRSRGVGSGWVEARRWRKPLGVVLIGGRMRGCGGGSAQQELRPPAVRLPRWEGEANAEPQVVGVSSPSWCSEVPEGAPG